MICQVKYITEQKKVTEPLTAFSETVKTPDDVPILLEHAFTIFRSKRPRPVHISIPIDIQAQPVNTNWEPIQIPPCPKTYGDDLLKAVSLINKSKKIVCILGGGSSDSGKEVSKLVDNLGAVVITTTAGKGVINDNHPLVISGGTVRAEAREYLSKADLILAIGTEMAETVAFLVDRGIPVMGHVGLMPQSVNKLGGYQAVGRDKQDAAAIISDARAISDAGAFSIVVEGVMEPIGRAVTHSVPIPTIGIGASAECDGQVLVSEDMLGLFNDFTPRFVKRYADLSLEIEKAATSYAEDVKARRFPGPENVFRSSEVKTE